MIRLTKLADYGIVLLIFMAKEERGRVHAASDLSQRSHLPLPTVSRLLKTLTSEGLLESRRGVKGGYVLSRDPAEISALEAIQALEGPVALTECTELENGGDCEAEPWCPAQRHWQLINQTVSDSLASISLADMAGPAPPEKLVELELDAVRGTQA
ncbi:MAG: SUF system Fe-S cluster assembly regulator [Acidobacteriota bacterium]